MTERISSRMNAIPDAKTAKELRTLLEACQTDLAALRAVVAKLQVDSAAYRTCIAALQVDSAAYRTTIAALQVDCANRLANHNTLVAKLNLDGGVTDTDYAAGTAATASAPAAATASAPAAATATAAPAALTFVK